MRGDVVATQERGVDNSMFVSFAMDGRDPQGFIDSAKSTEPPREGDRAVVDRASLGWDIQASSACSAMVR